MKMLKIFYYRINVVFQFGHAMELYIEKTWHNSLIHKDIICPPKTMMMIWQYLSLLCSLNQEWYISSTHPVRSCVFGSSNYCELFVYLVGFYIKAKSGNPSNEDLIWVKIEYVHEQPILVYKHSEKSASSCKRLLTTPHGAWTDAVAARIWHWHVCTTFKHMQYSLHVWPPLHLILKSTGRSF